MDTVAKRNGTEKEHRGVISRLTSKMHRFLSRLFYIVGLVWEASPFALIAMALLCLLDGTLPVIGAYITRDIMNEIAALIGKETGVGTFGSALATLAPVLVLFLYQMLYSFL